MSEEEEIICALGSLLEEQRESLRRTNRPAGTPRAILLFFSATFNGGNPGGGGFNGGGRRPEVADLVAPLTNREAMAVRCPMSRLAGQVCELEILPGANLPQGAHRELGAWVVEWRNVGDLEGLSMGGSVGRVG